MHVCQWKYSCETTKFAQKMDSETLFLEVNLRLRKWQIVGAYKPSDQSKSLFLESLFKGLSIYLDIYENVILLGDFNMTL